MSAQRITGLGAEWLVWCVGAWVRGVRGYVVGGRDQQSHCFVSQYVCTYTYPRDSPFYKRVKAACDGTKDCDLLDIWDDRIMCEGQERVVLYFTVTFNCIRPTGIRI